MLTWTLIISGAAIVLALAMHFLVPAKGVKIPAVILGTVGGLVIGVCVGFMGAVYYGDEVQKKVYANEYAPSPMPTNGEFKGKGSAAPASPPAEKKSEGEAPKGTPGSRSRPPGYPAPTDGDTKSKSEDSKSGDESKKTEP